MGRPKKQKSEEVKSSEFSTAGETTPATQPETAPEINTQPETAPEIAPEDPETTEIPEITPEAPEGFEALLDTFKRRPDVKEAFISEELKQWFFREKTARKYFDDFRRVENPFAK